MDAQAEGVERDLCSTISIPAVYWLSMCPLYRPGFSARKGVSPTERAGLRILFSLLSDITETIVTAIPIISIGSDTGVPWKLAPVRTRSSSGKNTGLSPTPFNSISTWVLA